jgi:hypothetical protein
METAEAKLKISLAGLRHVISVRKSRGFSLGPFLPIRRALSPWCRWMKCPIGVES